GDYNINLLKESTKKERLMNTIKSYGLVPIFSEASRAGKRTSSSIDNVFTNITNNCLNSKTIEPFLPNHKGQTLWIEEE
ncbi:hypothetical protein HHI36_015272, partial [Cryptolaemus montrouzieri]